VVVYPGAANNFCSADALYLTGIIAFASIFLEKTGALLDFFESMM
jgi:hypothetical protein